MPSAQRSVVAAQQSLSSPMDEEENLNALHKVGQKLHEELVADHASDTDIMIELLEGAMIHSDMSASGYHQARDPQLYSVALDLLEEKMIRGGAGPGVAGKFVFATGITLKGREYLDRLRRERYEQSFRAKTKKVLWGASCTLFGAVITHVPDIITAVSTWWHQGANP
jgi:hypothetical protein